MKNNLIKLLFVFGIFGILIACSTQKDRFLNRKFQALNTEYNVLYNGDLALEKGIEDLKTQYDDDFWQLLPVERMVVSKENSLPGENTKNANFERAEEKATKAIQRRSMNIDGREVNAQMDEAHLLLGKARYYDLRFVPALEAFNYVLYKYPESDKIYEVKIWREKTNMRMENDAIAVINLRKLLREIKFKDQIFADANATLAQAFLNLEEKDSALIKLKIATQYTKLDEEKARYKFIVGQLLNEMGQKDSAFAYFQSVIEMKRKAPRRYVIQAHLQQAKSLDYKNIDSLAFLTKFNALLKDRENRPFLDFLNHQMALFYDKQDKHKQASHYYNKSLKAQAKDKYLIASNYRNLATLNFDDAKYPTAGKYYDSTLIVLDARTREHKAIKKKRENLEDVIKYEAIAQSNDSIINLVQMSKEGQTAYFDKFITELKERDKKAAELLKKQEEIAQIKTNSTLVDEDSPVAASKNSYGPPQEIGPKGTETFYFYNPSTVAFGKNEFRKKWGKRNLEDNWRWSQNSRSNDGMNAKDVENPVALEDNEKELEGEKKEDPKYSVAFYTAKLPSKKADIDSLMKERNFAYYQLGVIYKEKFKEYELAAEKLEKLLENKPEERLILPSMYNLYKIYEIISPSKSLAMKQQILSKYPDSRYAQIIANDGLNVEQMSQTPEAKYEGLYKKYEKNSNVALLNEVEDAIDLYTGDEIVSKFELLKANIIGKLKGVEEYKKALNFVALNYPNSTEGKTAETLLTKNIPYLQQLKLNGELATSWKLIYKITDTTSASNKTLVDKIKKFTSERTAEKLSYSIDNYFMDEILLIIHGIPSAVKANDIVAILKDYKDFQIKEPVIIVSTENYKVIQIKKSLEEYLKIKSEGPAQITPAGPPESIGNDTPEVNTTGQGNGKTDVKSQVKPAPKPEVKTDPKSAIKQEKLNPTEITNEITFPTKKP